MTDFESIIQATYESVLVDGDIAIDVGAYEGRHTIPMAKKVFPHGRVFAFEPLPICRAALISHLIKRCPELREIITIYSYALSDYEGEADFVVAIDALGYSGLKERVYDTSTRLKTIRITVKRIDSLLSDLSSLKYIKIDAEGGELHILRGAIECIQKFRPLVTFEFGENSSGQYNITSKEMAEFWVKNEYVVHDIKGNYLSVNDFVQSANLQNVWDYIAIPSENRTLQKTVLKALKSLQPNFEPEGPIILRGA